MTTSTINALSPMVWFIYIAIELVFLAILLLIWLRPVSEQETSAQTKSVVTAVFAIASLTWTGLIVLAPGVTIAALASLGAG